MIFPSYEGYDQARELVRHGKINHGAFKFGPDDETRMLGPAGTDLANHASHHLGVDENEPYTSPKRHRYPFGKDGEIYSRALHGIRNEAHDAGHDQVRDMASKLLGDIKVKTDPSERSLRHIVKDGSKFKLFTRDGSKLLSTHDSYEGALKQEEAIKAHEAAAAAEGKSLFIPDQERRMLMLELAELRVGEKDGKPVVHGYAARFNSSSEPLPYEDPKTKQRGMFVERIHPRAFEAALKTADVRALVNHDPNLVMGRSKSGTLQLGTDDKGLHYSFSPPDTPIAQHYLESIRRGDMDGSSFSFTTGEGGDEWDHQTDPPTRTVRSVRNLYDVGPVTYPAYQDASVAARSLERSRTANPQIYRQRLLRLRLTFPSFPIPKGHVDE